jgi:heterodisulfide reductase subunit A-like polyferredoxin
VNVRSDGGLSLASTIIRDASDFQWKDPHARSPTAEMRATSLYLSLVVRSALASTLYSNSFGVPGRNATYDYVVIGGGTAGLTIAARLAEDPNVSVAVVEAGGFYQQENGNGR